MEKPKKEAYARVQSVQEGLDILDRDRNTMFAFLPLQQNQYLDDFTQNIRQKQLCALFTGAITDITLSQYEEMFPKDLSPFVTTSGRLNGEYLLRPSHETKFNTVSGAHADLSLKADGLYIHKIAIQSDHRRSIGSDWHRDSANFVVNLYAKGDPLKYKIDGQAIQIKAPAVFMHRGILHPFGESAAVEHKGREQRGERANVAYILNKEEPLANMDYMNY